MLAVLKNECLVCRDKLNMTLDKRSDAISPLITFTI